MNNLSYPSSTDSLSTKTQYSKIAMDNGTYEYIYYNTNNTNHIYQTNYDYYCSQYYSNNYPHNYPHNNNNNTTHTYSTNCTYYGSRNHEIQTNSNNKSSKIAKDPSEPSLASSHYNYTSNSESKIAIAYNDSYSESYLSSQSNTSIQ